MDTEPDLTPDLGSEPITRGVERHYAAHGNDQTIGWLNSRARRMGGPGPQVPIELGLWRQYLTVEQALLPFTLGELAWVAACYPDGPGLAATVAATRTADVVEAAVRNDSSRFWALAGEWAIDTQALFASLRGLSPVQDHALRDGLSKWAEDGLEVSFAALTRAGFIVRQTDERPG